LLKSDTNTSVINDNNYDTNLYSILFSQLEPGDIVFRKLRIIGHCLMYIGYNFDTNEYEFIEANMNCGVHYQSFDEDELKNELYNFFVRVKTANNIQKENAIEFVKRQLKKGFDNEFLYHDKNHNPEDSFDPCSNVWYCSELIWAAYYNCNNSPGDKIYGNGIDIDFDGWKKDWFEYSLVSPIEIIRDNDIELFFLEYFISY
jgi:uncharacterized protein YycO